MYLHKLIVPLAALFLFSGCCDLLGICTSASVHTSISSPQGYAQQQNPQELRLASQSPQSCTQ